MKKLIILGLSVMMIMTFAACGAQAQAKPLSAEETVKRFFDCFNSRDAAGINALMVEGCDVTLSEDESATLTLSSCSETVSEDDASVVEADFTVSVSDTEKTSFEEGEYTWKFELEKGEDGVWRIYNYGV